MYKTSKERHQIAIEKDIKLEMTLNSPSEAARQHMESKPYTYPEASKRVRKFVTGQRKQRKERTSACQ